MAKQPKGKRETSPTVHSYLHLVRKNGIHPYIKRPMDMRSVTSWTVPDLCAAYDWPKQDAPGGGVIAIVELGGGWTHADVTKFFTAVKLPAPNITDVSVDGTTNSQCNPKTAPTAKSRSTSRSRAPLTPSRPARPRKSASTGRRTLPKPLQRRPPMAATSARSPGAPTRPAGAPLRATRWSSGRRCDGRRHGRFCRVGRQ